MRRMSLGNPPILTGFCGRTNVASFSLLVGTMPLSPGFGRSLLYVRNDGRRSIGWVQNSTLYNDYLDCDFKRVPFRSGPTYVLGDVFPVSRDGPVRSPLRHHTWRTKFDKSGTLRIICLLANIRHVPRARRHESQSHRAGGTLCQPRCQRA